MKIQSLFLATAVLAGGLALAGGASAMPMLHVDTALATANDGAHVENARVYCSYAGCVRVHHYGYHRYGYGYRTYGYGYHPYGYTYGLPGVRLGFY